MNMRPRYNDWMPLITQQMRLRNLMKIEGYNIECGSWLNVYYTLHFNWDTPAVYKSEALPQRHLQQKWAEINCDEMLKSNCQCVCVKVWAEDSATVLQQQDTVIDEQAMKQAHSVSLKQQCMGALTKQLTAVSCIQPHKQPRPPDRLLFMWGVYLSGLTQLSNRSYSECAANTLVFQINGEFFTAPEYITSGSLRMQLSLNYERYSASMPKTTPIEDSFSLGINSPPVSRSSSPVTMDNTREMLRMSKTRFAQLYCDISDVRQSYDLQQLLRMQELQRLYLQKQRECTDIVADIKEQSLPCITAEQALRKRRSASSSYSNSYHNHYHHPQKHSMGRTLSNLLAEQTEIDPRKLLQAQELVRQLEVSRSRHKVLLQERQQFRTRIEQLKQKLDCVSRERQNKLQWLKNERLQLNEDISHMELSAVERVDQLQVRRHIEANVGRRMCSLCLELREIYPIQTIRNDLYTICGIPCPNLDAYCRDAKYAHSISQEYVSPLALSASLGYIAHLVQMISVINDRPLRHPIIHEGSRSRICDIIKEMPYTSREFPLYSRSAIPSKSVKYAIFLLNQNIAQLCFDITGNNCDARFTIKNLMDIFEVMSSIHFLQRDDCVDGMHSLSRTLPGNRLAMDPEYAHQTGSVDIAHTFDGSVTDVLDECEEGLSKSNSSVDINHQHATHLSADIDTCMEKCAIATNGGLGGLLMPPRASSMPLQIGNGADNTTQLGISRSVGSYSDSEDNLKHFVLSHSRSDSKINIANSSHSCNTHQ